MEINQIKVKYDNIRTFNNTKSKLKRVNTILSLEPTDVIHTDKYVEQFDTLVSKLMVEPGVNGSIIKSKDELLALIGVLSGAVSRTLSFGQVNPLVQLIANFKKSYLHGREENSNSQQLRERKAPQKWDEILIKLNNVLSNNPNPFAKVVAVCYKHGYVLRINEIFNTSISKIGDFNHLDLDNLVWHVNFSKGVRKFPVTREFVDELKPLLSTKCPLLIFKSTLQPYTIQTHAVIDLAEEDGLPSNSEIRSSYQAWNWNKSDKTYEQCTHIETNVMGNSEMSVCMNHNPLLREEEQKQKIKVVIRKKN